MGLTNRGTIHLFGISGTVANATVSDASFDEVCANMANVVDEIGNAINRRYDDITITGTVTIIIRGAYTLVHAGATFTYDGVTYEITGVGRKQTSRGYRIVEVRVITSENISLA